MSYDQGFSEQDNAGNITGDRLDCGEDGSGRRSRQLDSKLEHRVADNDDKQGDDQGVKPAARFKVEGQLVCQSGEDKRDRRPDEGKVKRDFEEMNVL